MESFVNFIRSGMAAQGGGATSGNSTSGSAQINGNQDQGAKHATRERTPERLLAPQTNPRPPTSAEILRIGLNKLAEDSDSGSDMDTGDSDDSLSSADSDVAATPAKSTPKPSITPLETVLFTSPTTFKTADDFFDQCRKKLESRSEYYTNRYQQEVNYLKAACTLRNKFGCRFVVRANRMDGGGWELDEQRSRWLHQHDATAVTTLARDSRIATTDANGDSSDSESESESEEEPLINQTARISSSGSKLRWNVKTSSKVVLDIVYRREEVFALQRRLASSHRQQTSEKIVQDEIESLPIPDGAPKPVYSYEHAKFLEFAELCKIPPYPITPPLIVLYLSYKASLAGGTQGSSRAWLNRLHRLLDATWEGQATYRQLEEWKDVEEGIREFMRERAESRARPPKPPAVVKKPLPTHPRTTQRQLNSSDLESSAHETDEDWSHADTRSDQHSDKETSEEDSDQDSVILCSEGRTDTRKREGSAKRNGSGSATTVQKAKITIPGLPSVDETVSSPVELYKLCVRKHIKILGINVNLMPSTDTTYRIRCSRHHTRYAQTLTGSCEFSIAIERVNKKWIVRPSKWEHNHGPAIERLANPEWMPRVLNPDARAALGLAMLPDKVAGRPRKKHKASSRNDTAGQTRKEDDEMPKKKKKKRSHETPIPSFTLSQQSYPSPAATDQLHRSPKPQIRPPPPQETFRQPNIPQPKPRIHPVVPAPALASSSSSTLVPAIPTPQPSPATPAESEEAFFPNLVSFLSALHPSLDALAPALFASGVRSFEVLSLFAAFESTTIDLYLAELRKHYEISNVHLKIFKKKLVDAKEEGWMN